MKAFFWRIISALGRIGIFKNFAKPIPKPASEILEENIQPTVSTPYQTLEISSQCEFAESSLSLEASSDESPHETTAVATLPEVICLPNSFVVSPIQNLTEQTSSLADYDIQSTAVFDPEKENPVPIRIIKSADNILSKRASPRTKKPTVRRAGKTKSVESTKHIPKKSKLRVKKKIAPIPPEATGFGFQKKNSDN